jgi:hypothetical protein
VTIYQQIFDEMPYSVYHLPGVGYVAVQTAPHDEHVLLWTSTVAWPTREQAQHHVDELESLRQKTIGELSGQRTTS